VFETGESAPLEKQSASGLRTKTSHEKEGKPSRAGLSKHRPHGPHVKTRRPRSSEDLKTSPVAPVELLGCESKLELKSSSNEPTITPRVSNAKPFVTKSQYLADRFRNFKPFVSSADEFTQKWAESNGLQFKTDQKQSNPHGISALCRDLAMLFVCLDIVMTDSKRYNVLDVFGSSRNMKFAGPDFVIENWEPFPIPFDRVDRSNCGSPIVRSHPFHKACLLRWEAGCGCLPLVHYQEAYKNLSSLPKRRFYDAVVFQDVYMHGSVALLNALRAYFSITRDVYIITHSFPDDFGHDFFKVGSSHRVEGRYLRDRLTSRISFFADGEQNAYPAHYDLQWLFNWRLYYNFSINHLRTIGPFHIFKLRHVEHDDVPLHVSPPRVSWRLRPLANLSTNPDSWTLWFREVSARECATRRMVETNNYQYSEVVHLLDTALRFERFSESLARFGLDYSRIVSDNAFFHFHDRGVSAGDFSRMRLVDRKTVAEIKDAFTMDKINETQEKSIAMLKYDRASLLEKFEMRVGLPPASIVNTFLRLFVFLSSALLSYGLVMEEPVSTSLLSFCVETFCILLRACVNCSLALLECLRNILFRHELPPGHIPSLFWDDWSVSSILATTVAEEYFLMWAGTIILVPSLPWYTFELFVNMLEALVCLYAYGGDSPFGVSAMFAFKFWLPMCWWPFRMFLHCLWNLYVFVRMRPPRWVQPRPNPVAQMLAEEAARSEQARFEIAMFAPFAQALAPQFNAPIPRPYLLLPMSPPEELRGLYVNNNFAMMNAEAIYTQPLSLPACNSLLPSLHLVHTMAGHIRIKGMDLEETIHFHALHHLDEPVQEGVWPIIATCGLMHTPAKTLNNLFVALLNRTHLRRVHHLRLNPTLWASLSGFDFEVYISELPDEKECIAKSNNPRVLERAFRDLHWSDIPPKYNSTVFVKTDETLPYKVFPNFLKPRVIENVDPQLQAIMQPYARAVGDLLKTHFDGRRLSTWNGRPVRIIYGSGSDQKRINSIGQILRESKEDVILVAGDDGVVKHDTKYYSSDFSSFDQSQSSHSIKAVLHVLSRLLVPMYILEIIWKLAHAPYRVRSPILKIRGGGVVRMPTGIVWTTVINSVTNILAQLAVIQFGTDVIPELGFIIKRKHHPYFNTVDFLKGWWLPSKTGELEWHPLPSCVLKMGKLSRPPHLVTRQSGRPDDDWFTAARKILYSMGRTWGPVSRDYPILGAFLDVFERYGLAHDLDLRYSESRRNPVLRTVQRSVALECINARYGLSSGEVEEVERMIRSVRRIPVFLVHPTFLRLLEVDYG